MGQTSSETPLFSPEFLERIEREAEREADRKYLQIKEKIILERASSDESLFQMLASDHYENQYFAASALLEKAIPKQTALNYLYNHNDWRIRTKLASRLSVINSPLSFKRALLAGLIHDENPQVMAGAAYSIGILNLGELLPGVVLNLTNKDPLLLANSASAIGKFGIQSISAIPLLFFLLKVETHLFVIDNVKASLKRIFSNNHFLLYGSLLGSLHITILTSCIEAFNAKLPNNR
jgi:hypothetical protein